MKTLLILLISMYAMTTYAQHTDTTLLTGKWNLYAIKDTDRTVYRDSIDQAVAAAVRDLRSLSAEFAHEQWSAADSLSTAAYMRESYQMKFRGYMRFDTATHRMWVFVPMAGSETPCSYRWRSDGDLDIAIAGMNPQVLNIRLSQDRLVVINRLEEMIYTRDK